jgi:hypothetical protein
MSVSGRKASISASALQSRIDRGEGEGIGPNFQPWHTTQNSKGPGHKGKYECPITKRVRYFLSETEEGTIYSCLRDPDVEDARENIRLAIGLTRPICEHLGIRHPRSTGEGEPLLPYTTDLLLTRRTPPRHIALYLKLRASLRKPSESNSLLVEHAYWSLHRVPFFVVTDHEISRNALESLRFFRPKGHLADLERDKERREEFLKHAFSADWSAQLLDVVRGISVAMGIDGTDGLELFKALVWNNSLECDMERGIGAHTRNALRASMKRSK